MLKRSYSQTSSLRRHFTVSSNTILRHIIIQRCGDLIDKTMINRLITQNKH